MPVLVGGWMVAECFPWGGLKCQGLANRVCCCPGSQYLNNQTASSTSATPAREASLHSYRIPFEATRSKVGHPDLWQLQARVLPFLRTDSPASRSQTLPPKTTPPAPSSANGKSRMIYTTQRKDLVIGALRNPKGTHFRKIEELGRD